MKQRFKNLEDYGIIGNLETCALIAADGSIDWLCLPYLDSAAPFAALLDPERGGVFRIGPVRKFKSVQNYLGDTNVLKTTFHAAGGIASVTDFMPVKTIESAPFRSAVFRKVLCEAGGEIEMEIDFRPRFNYARDFPEFNLSGQSVRAVFRDEKLFLHSPIPLDLSAEGAYTRITMQENKPLWFVMQYHHESPITADDCDGYLQRTIHFWKNWTHSCGRHGCPFEGPWHDFVVRSGLVLKLLTNTDTGAIAAAATTSLPEVVGGIRNWDYRYTWIRDASLTVRALLSLGYDQEASKFFEWVRNTVSRGGDVSKMRIMYPLRTETDLREEIVDSLSGYRDSGPVRIGNAAAGQVQVDIFGEILDVTYEMVRVEGSIPDPIWQFAKNCVDQACRVWQFKDHSIWEVRKASQDYVYSKLMSWVAIDRGIRIAEEKGYDAPLKMWREQKERVRNTILERGFSRKLNSFVSILDSEEMDATSLLIPLRGLLPVEDPRVQGTIDAVMKHLMFNKGLVKRYTLDDGLPGREGAFVLCSFWLIIALSLSGRRSEAEDHFLELLKYLSPLGLISEEVDPATGRLLGNMPQAFSHIGLINAALQIGMSRDR